MKMKIILVLIIYLIQSLVARKKQIIVPNCDIILNTDLCDLQSHCRWSFSLDQCLERIPVYVNRVMMRPFARYGVFARPAFESRPSYMSTSRPAFSSYSSRPVQSRPMSFIKRNKK